MITQEYMVAFNRSGSKPRAVIIKQRIAITQAKLGSTEMKLKHPDWCRDASKGDFTMLKKKIKEDCEKKQMRNEKFRSILHGKN